MTTLEQKSTFVDYYYFFIIVHSLGGILSILPYNELLWGFKLRLRAISS
jgi:hypothetical protein